MRALFLLLVLGFPVLVWAGALDETRYCGQPKRDVSGQIIRRADVLAAFKKIHPCPLTGRSTGSCSGMQNGKMVRWQINHVIPLACGGCDAVSNLDWMPAEIKTCSTWFCRDRFERKIYGGFIESKSCRAPPLGQ